MAEEDNLTTIFATWATNAEIQALFLVGCTCVGAWVLFRWLLQMVFSALWPFFMVLVILIMMPGWRRTIVKDVVPKHLETIKYLGQKLAVNSSSSR